MFQEYRNVVEKYGSLYDQEPLIVRSPGRINLLGEHVDYNDGFVMPASISYATIFCIGEANDGVSEIYSTRYEEPYRINSDIIGPVDQPCWVNYLLGVLDQIKRRGYAVKPFKCVFGGDIPMGAGLSSSASIECGFAFALDQMNDLHIDKQTLIRIAQWAEHHYAGVMCGVMDQFACMMGADDHLIMLDCASMDYSYVPFKLADHAIVLCDSRIKHSLADSEYNVRRRECEQGLEILKGVYPAVRGFRDVEERMVVLNEHRFPGKVFDRCLYVVQEIERVRTGKEDLLRHRLGDFGKRMFQTHDGLSRLYEVSCKELDFLVNEAAKFDQVLGARMMGGGFGGCTINLVEHSFVEEFIDIMARRYKEDFERDMSSHVVKITGGTHVVEQFSKRPIKEA